MSLLLNSILNNTNLQMNVGYSDNLTDDYLLYDNSFFKLKLSLFDKFFVAKKQVWSSDKVLNEYPNSDCHYLVDNKVYLCIQNNNNSISTNTPYGTSVFNFETNDGYVWRYLFTIQTDDMIDYIRLSNTIAKPPIKNSIVRLKNYIIPDTITFEAKPKISFISDTGSGLIIDFNYINKKVSDLKVTSGGNSFRKTDCVLISDDDLGNGASIDYSLVNGSLVIHSFIAGGNYTNPKIHVIGDGSGAKVASSILNGSFDNISVISGGSNYTWIKLIIAPSQNSYVSSVVLESPNGFGFDVIKDINSLLMISKKVDVNLDTTINYIMITDTTISNEYPDFYIINNITNKILSKNSENLIQIILNEDL